MSMGLVGLCLSGSRRDDPWVVGIRQGRTSLYQNRIHKVEPSAFRLAGRDQRWVAAVVAVAER